MNYLMITYMLGWILRFQSMFLLLPCLVAVIYGEMSGAAFLITAALCGLLGFLAARKKPANAALHAKEGFVIVAMSWLILSFTGAVPFVINGEIPHIIDAMFETTSGFTTTGASILVDVEVLSKCSLFWRSFTHWVGGMGVLVFVLAILPSAGGQNMYIMKAESPGPSVSKLVPKVRTTAMILYGIYLAMTVAQFLLLVIGRMPVFDALTTTFGTAGTGGFGVKNSSLGGYSSYIQVVTSIFMILFGVNFNIYFLFLCRKGKQAIRSSEVLTYLGIIALSTVTIGILILNSYQNPGEAFKHSLFQVSSIITTTGFSTADFNLWPQMARTILVMLMFIGACAGSTGGGIKVSRFIILIKTVKKEIKQMIHPRAIGKVKMDGKIVEHEVIRAVNVFMVAYLLIFAFSVLLISVDEFDLTTNFTSVAATLNNIGPGLEVVGPTGNFSQFSGFSKIVLMFDMLAGRLEIFPMLLFLAPSTWKRK